MLRILLELAYSANWIYKNKLIVLWFRTTKNKRLVLQKTISENWLL